MKKMIKMKNLVLAIIALLSIVSCNEISDSNDITRMNMNYYDSNGNRILGKIPAEVADYLKDVSVEAVPLNNDDLKTVVLHNFNDNQVAVPLNLNEVNKGKNSKNPEEFRYVLSYKGEEVFNKVFQLSYRNGDPFKTVSKVNVKNENGAWEPYAPQRMQVLKDGKPTGFSYEVLIPNQRGN